MVGEAPGKKNAREYAAIGERGEKNSKMHRFSTVVTFETD